MVQCGITQPEEYAELLVEVLCNECGAKSVVPFHVIGAKVRCMRSLHHHCNCSHLTQCTACNVYNTVRTRGPFAKDSS